GDFTVFGSEVLFAGTDPSNKRGLWVTDGTSAGTSEIMAGASSLGLSPTNIIAVGSEALFNGIDTAGPNGLWVTDGTSGGTSELISVAGVSPNGLNPTNFVVPVAPTIGLPSVPFDLNGDTNSDLVFQNNGQAGVWLMNGTTPIAEAGLGN